MTRLDLAVTDEDDTPQGSGEAQLDGVLAPNRHRFSYRHRGQRVI